MINYDELNSRGKVTADWERVKDHSCGGRCWIEYDESRQYRVECEKCGTVSKVTTTSLDNAIRLWNDGAVL